MIDEKKLLEELEKLPYINGNYDKKNSNLLFVCGAESFHEMVVDVINEQPKISLENKTSDWIPVEEALPKEHEVVLVWYEYFRYGDYNRMYQTYGFGYHFRNGFWSGDVSGEKARCIAWQPLPKPYEVQDETN